MRIGYTLLIFKEGVTYVSFCPELSVSSCGDTVDEARKRGGEAVRLFLSESSKLGTLKDILEEEGFVKSADEWLSPPLVATEHCEVAL